MKKELEVPYIPGIDEMSPESREEIMELHGARTAVDSANWPDQYPYKPIVSATLAAGDSYLWVNFFVRGLGLKAEYGETNEPVWQDSCVEVFIENPAGGYRNFEMNCIGTLLSAYQKARGIDVERITEEEAGEVIRYTSVPHETFAERDGIHEWTATLGIPFRLMGYAGRPDSIKCNLYKCADGSRWMHYVSWSPIDTPKPDFHRPDFFGTLRLMPAENPTRVS